MPLHDMPKRSNVTRSFLLAFNAFIKVVCNLSDSGFFLAGRRGLKAVQITGPFDNRVTQ